MVVVQNDTDADTLVQGATIPSHGIRAVVHGGTDAEIAAAIKAAKSVGPATGGTVLEDGYRFDRAVPTPVALTLTVVKGSTYPPDGDEKVKTALTAYATSWGIGEKPDNLRLIAAALAAVPGFMVTAHALTIVNGGGALPAEAPFAALYTLGRGERHDHGIGPVAEPEAVGYTASRCESSRLTRPSSRAVLRRPMRACP